MTHETLALQGSLRAVARLPRAIVFSPFNGVIGAEDDRVGRLVSPTCQLNLILLA